MKTLIPMGLALVLMGCATLQTSSSEDLMTGQTLEGHAEVIMVVHGLSCPLCSTNLDRQLMRIDGVSDAVVDLGTGEVTVKFEDGHAVAADDLASRVDDAGFTLRSIQPRE